MAMYYTPIPYEFLEEMGELSDAEFGRLIRWCLTYSITGEESELSGNERFFRIRCKKQIDAIVSNYDAMCEKNRINGAKGGRPRKNPPVLSETQDNPEEPRETQNNPPVFSETQNNPEEPKKPNINLNTNLNTNIKKEKDDTVVSSKKKAVITAWNKITEGTGIPRIIDIKCGTQREQMLNARIKEYGLDTVLDAIAEIGKSDFLQGKKSQWIIRFDWFIRPNNFSKVLEGNYRDKEPSESRQTTSNSGSWAEIAQAVAERSMGN